MIDFVAKDAFTGLTSLKILLVARLRIFQLDNLSFDFFCL